MTLASDASNQQEPKDHVSATDSEAEPVTNGPENDSEPENEREPEDGSQETRCRPGKLNWVADPKKALLRRSMGISADVDSMSQEVQSRDLRREVRALAGIDFTKTWTELENEGKTEGMISSTSTPANPPYPSVIRNTDRPPAGVIQGMGDCSWDRPLAMKVIKSIISRGRVNAARKRNRESV